jgi:hypothetical protein
MVDADFRLHRQSTVVSVGRASERITMTKLTQGTGTTAPSVHDLLLQLVQFG